ncbi:MAG: PKD domain-containing protein [Desulfuromonadaceae bacterium]|nr:PKD domain-containing protein [Desulfuromonadaceae bacterium]
MRIGRWFGNMFLIVAAVALLPMAAFAAAPVVKTVPWVASNPLIPHDAYAGKQVTLKGTTDMASGAKYHWDFGDLSAPTADANVTNNYVLEAKHTYAGAVGTVYTATLTVTNIATNESASKNYFVKMQEKTLGVESNIAIDEGLWYLHKTQNRSIAGCSECGSWSGYQSIVPANVNAFEVNGHRENGAASNPYTETVSRGMRYLFTQLASRAISAQNDPVNGGTYDPDVNGNGFGIYNTQYPEGYQAGMFLDAIVASGTPDALAPTGPANVVGRKYIDIVQDMVDSISYCQYDYGVNGGSWIYSCNNGNDNSISQWMAIGLLGAKSFGATLPMKPSVAKPNVVVEWNKAWLKYSQNSAGYFGYTNYNYIWGPYAVTPSGMVQLVLDGIGRGTSPAAGPSWEKAETFLRENWDNTGGAYYAIKDYYYGLFSFTKAMLLHDPDGNGQPNPITCLHSSNAGTTKPDIDWYAAEVGKVDSCSGGLPTSNGVARTLINTQAAAGNWSGHNYTSEQYTYETAWAIMMLNRTVFDSGVPVAVATATPNPVVNGQLVTLSGAGSFHQDAAKAIDSWQWDFDNDGVFDATGPVVTTTFPALGSYPVKLRVTDNGSPEGSAETIITILVNIPPLTPTANAGGQYSFCENRKPWYLNGAASVNPDDGQSEFGLPGDFIKSYAWDLDGNGTYGDVNGANPDVTAFFTTAGFGNYLVQLKVTDNTAISFPSSGKPDLFSTDTAQVSVKAATDLACVSCVSNLAARPKGGKVGLTWSKKPTAVSYNVYRGTTTGGPYAKIGTVTQPAISLVSYFDGAVVNGTTYFYVVKEVAANSAEYCQSNQAQAKPTL